jgi:hypothetical protein
MADLIGEEDDGLSFPNLFQCPIEGNDLESDDGQPVALAQGSNSAPPPGSRLGAFE